jgi:hypothetical protein
MADRSRWRLTPRRWLLIKLASVLPIVFFLERVVIRIRPGDLVFFVVIPMGIIVFDGLVTMWTYARQSKIA